MESRPESTRLWLIRHGAVDEAWAGRIYGGLDVPLATRGRSQAERVARELADEPLSAVVSSGLARTEYGAAILRQGRDIERRDELQLVEIDRGEWAGLSFAELEEREAGAWARWWAHPGQRRAPGGESLEELAARVLPCLETLVGEFRGQTIAVVCHSWVIRVGLCAVLGLEPGFAARMEVGTGSLSLVEIPEDAQGLAGGVLLGLGLERVPG